ncbi:MAG: hypothetical protein J5733_04845 [Bacteroidaceae bacterium]|nr:hypothetical protein [Bacteroidaceae bacterium]
MTLGEALELAKPKLMEMLGQVVRDNLEGKGADEYGDGIDAICEVFGCCRSTAVKHHHEPFYKPAYRQDGKRRFTVNKTQLRKLREEYQKERIRKGLA